LSSTDKFDFKKYKIAEFTTMILTAEMRRDENKLHPVRNAHAHVIAQLPDISTARWELQMDRGPFPLAAFCNRDVGRIYCIPRYVPVYRVHELYKNMVDNLCSVLSF
jgi:hypothetical protein